MSKMRLKWCISFRTRSRGGRRYNICRKPGRRARFRFFFRCHTWGFQILDSTQMVFLTISIRLLISAWYEWLLFITSIRILSCLNSLFGSTPKTKELGKGLWLVLLLGFAQRILTFFIWWEEFAAMLIFDLFKLVSCTYFVRMIGEALIQVSVIFKHFTTIWSSWGCAFGQIAILVSKLGR